MTRTVKTRRPIRLEKFNDGWQAATIEVDKANLDSILLELSLIREDLVERVVFLGQAGTSISAQLKNDSDWSSGSFTKEKAVLNLCLREVDFTLSFLLKYYRDGVADVDHIDVAIFDRNSDAEIGTLTIHVADARPPISGEEAMRILSKGR
jgi:hypothetical protein